jgi:hypothetical protein
MENIDSDAEDPINQLCPVTAPNTSDSVKVFFGLLETLGTWEESHRKVYYSALSNARQRPLYGLRR